MASTISAGTTTTTALVQTADTSGVLQLQTNGGTTAVTIDTAQNVGIGVTPSAWGANYKGIQTSSGAFVSYSNTSQDIYYGAYDSSAGTWKYTVTGYGVNRLALTNGTFQFYVAPSGTAGNAITFTQAMILDNIGNLSNTGNILSGTYIKAATYLWAAGTGAAGGVYLGAGSITGAISQASQGGSTTTTYIGNAQITTVSDSRLKENVVDTTIKAVDTLNKLRIVDHTWNDPSDQCENNRNSRGTWVGLIAQEAQPIIPWLVNKPTEDVDKDGNPQYWHMDYGYSVPLLIKAIQELSAQVTTLQTQVTALKG